MIGFQEDDRLRRQILKKTNKVTTSSNLSQITNGSFDPFFHDRTNNGEGEPTYHSSFSPSFFAIFRTPDAPFILSPLSNGFGLARITQFPPIYADKTDQERYEKAVFKRKVMKQTSRGC
ncbi:unnamed protein product [Bursaphelenchus okinawaensis]|uniref:Uncharacterized protein n=1 Tax=Bursaphelenchus okinawaensis TaxID=465554 RepID=A0A811KWA8_9BILA|nr:unnamed protein product [Bursaphelenchus okinawaensis]CAG9113215.1 unnamed protein product [Bursaphelenchus okinawaensis]